MAYQDTIQVAQQKIRRGRMERIRDEAQGRDDQLMEVREYLHPQIDEIIDTMPTWLGNPLSQLATFRSSSTSTTHKGMVLNTSSVGGYTLLSIMARIRPLRPRSVRFVREQEEIDAWIGPRPGGRPDRPGAGDRDRQAASTSSRATAPPTSTAARASPS